MTQMLVQMMCAVTAGTWHAPGMWSPSEPFPVGYQAGEWAKRLQSLPAPGLHARCCRVVGAPLASVLPVLNVRLDPSRDGGGRGCGKEERGPETGPTYVGPLERESVHNTEEHQQELPSLHLLISLVGNECKSHCH